MNIYQLLVLALFITIMNAYKNNTDFWAKQLNDSAIHFQAYSGYEDIDTFFPHGSAKIFYSLYSAAGRDIKTRDSKVPLIIWLQGGPGASSQFGAFTEIGPIAIVNGTAKHFMYPWNLLGHLLFIDNPLNVGFSFNGNDRQGQKQVSSANEATDHLYNFLVNFYHQWPQLVDSPLYITGESFAGHYLPSLGRKLLNGTFTKLTGVTLAGISIGDGWTDPISQVNYYDSYLNSVGIASMQLTNMLTWFQTQSIVNMLNGRNKNATAYFDFITNNDTTPKQYFGGISMFNFRNYDDEDDSFVDFLNKYKSEFGADVKYIPGNDAIYTAFAEDVSTSYAVDVITCLRKTKVLIYNGQNDVVVNTAGVLQYLNGLNWQGIGQWKRTPKKLWTIYGEKRGWVKNSGNLWFALVNGAGHMVPSDQPQSAWILLAHFIKGVNEWDQ